MDEGRAYLEASDPAFHLVRYEDLTSTPRETLSELLAFTSLSQDEVLLRYGCDTLTQVPAKDKVALNPLVGPLFERMMDQYNYV
jgi:hypothetical protein